MRPACRQAGEEILSNDVLFMGSSSEESPVAEQFEDLKQSVFGKNLAYLPAKIQ